MQNTHEHRVEVVPYTQVTHVLSMDGVDHARHAPSAFTIPPRYPAMTCIGTTANLYCIVNQYLAFDAGSDSTADYFMNKQPSSITNI